MFGAVVALVLMVGGVVGGWALKTPRDKSPMMFGGGISIAGLLLFIFSTVIIVPVGEAGVKHFLGEVDTEVLSNGIHVINPFASVEDYEIREITYPEEGTVIEITAQTSEQLNVKIDVALLGRFVKDSLPRTYGTYGTEQDVLGNNVLNAIRAGVRDAVATRSLEVIFSEDRAELGPIFQRAIMAKMAPDFEVLEVFVRDIQPPQRVREAIESRQDREQQVAAEVFQTDIVREKALQVIEEARGIAESQKIIDKTLTPEYLAYLRIKALEAAALGQNNTIIDLNSSASILIGGR